MDNTDFDFPQYQDFANNVAFTFMESKPKQDILDQLKKPIIRVQYKLSSKRKQLVSEAEEEPEPLVTPRFIQATLSKNLTLRSMASQQEKDLSPKNKFKDDKKIEFKKSDLNLNIAGLQKLLKFKKDNFKTMRIDPMELSSREMEEIEKRNMFDGKPRDIKEEIYLPIHEQVKDFAVWNNVWNDRVMINKKNQKQILEILEKALNARIKIKGYQLVEVVSYVENMFIQQYQSEDQPLLVFDLEI
jgi:hypothetical protein